MNFTVTSRGDDLSNTLKQQIDQYLLDFGLSEDQKEPDLVVTIGGDGTLLQAFHDYSNRLENTAFVGIHTGHLAFMPIGFLVKLKNWSSILQKHHTRLSNTLCWK